MSVVSLGEQRIAHCSKSKGIMKTTVREKHLLGRMVCLVTLGLILCVPADAQVPVNVDDLLATCPSAKEISSINRDFTLTFESDPSAGTLVCMASNGSADLTLLMKNAYQALRVMQQIPFDAPFPWTTKNLYDWLKGAILGIRFRGDISSSFCCDPLGVINVQTHNLTILQTGRWVDPQLESGLQDFMVLVVHEARHSEGLPHDCGAFDQTISELGAWGVQYFIEEWLKYHSGTFLTATDPAIVGGGTDVGGNPLSPDYYRLIAWNDAQSVRATDFCTQPIFLSAPAAQNFGSQKVGTTSVPRAVVLAAGTPTAVEIGNIELTGIDKGDFILKVVSCPNAGLPPSCVLTASFSPTTNGIKAANITITDTAPGSPHVVPLLGTAISPSNLPPVANAGPNQTVECSGHGTPVTLDGSRSTDPEGDNLTYLWTNSTGTVVGNSAVISQTLSVGTFN
jgi:hypothetical protein